MSFVFFMFIYIDNHEKYEDNLKYGNNMNTKIIPYSNSYILGDVHGEWGKLNEFINKKKPYAIYQTGDFGWWPGHKGFEIDIIKNGKTKIFWCDGNHENHDDLERIRNEHPDAIKSNSPIEVAPNIFYCPRGTVITLEDGRKMMFFGGASSIDKKWRTPGYDWFSGEDIRPHDLDSLDEIGDIDISHTCPESFIGGIWAKNPVGMWDKKNDSANGYLEWILEHHHPKLWVLGHFHSFTTGFNKGCHWTLLNRCNLTNWFVKLI
jgi:hypothetical protein